MTEQSPAEAIFFAVLEKGTQEERVAYLDAACGNDANLRRRVERLLAAHPEIGNFLEATGGHKQAVGGSAETASYDGPVDAVGSVVAGRYKLIEALGEGGMGTVFMAQQTEPVKRLVALKVIKAGMDSKQVMARFEAERQALALMDHPNIAKVLDGGTTGSGWPFFVMELVKGIAITQFCDQQNLSTRERLALFVQVCQAIQHAHTKGIVHRDIKPSNVLVAQYDDLPVPKVIDFGVAKAAGQQLTDGTLVTGFGAILGTPEYMSPEQAHLNQLDIDTRSDVYTLGVLLYELLTGTTPIDRKRLGQAAVLEILRLIREEEPPRPSDRLSTSEVLASIAASRRTEPGKLAGLMRGELDWIVMKCLEKDRSRRYETASGLARDVERYLHDEIVEAKPPSASYLLRKFVRRNKGRLAATAAVLIALLVGGAAISWQAAERLHERAERLSEQQVITDRARQAVQLQLDRAEASLKDHKLSEVVGALAQSDLLLTDIDAPDLRNRLASVRKDLDMQGQLDDIFAWRWNLAKGQVRLSPNKAIELYPPAIRKYGLAIGEESPETTVQTIRRSAIADSLRVALEQWLVLNPSQPGLLGVLNAEDPHPIRVQIRIAIAAQQHDRVLDLVTKANQGELTPPLATALSMSKLLPLEDSQRLMKSLWHRQPNSFPLAMAIAAQLTELDLILGNAMEAVGWCRTAVAIQPDSAFAHHCLGVALGEIGDADGRSTELKEAMRLAPRFQRAAAVFIFNLLILDQKNKTQNRGTAFSMCQNLLQVNPKHPIGHGGLYLICQRESNWVEAARHYRSFYDAVVAWSKEEAGLYSCPEEAFMLGLVGPGWRFEEVLTGLKDKGHSEEAFRLCEHTISDKEISDLTTSWVYANRPHESLYQGACAGVLWSRSDAALPVAERDAIRLKARRWISAMLIGWTRCFDADSIKNRELVHEQMTHWLADPKLGGVRDEKLLVELPVDERAKWQALWADVRSLRDRTAPPATPAKP